MNKRTYQIQIRKGHKLYPYFKTTCSNSKNLSNTTHFFIRQVYTGLKNNKPLHPLQKEVIDTIKQNIDRMNDRQLNTYRRKLSKEKQKPKDEQKDIKANVFETPSSDKPYVSYGFLDCLFKIINQRDYKNLPTQNAQGVMKQVFQDWKSFFKSLDDYKKNSTKYKSKPKIPNYSKGDEKQAIFSNQDCVIKERKYLKFPKTKTRLNIGKLGIKGKLKQVRVYPKYQCYLVELVMDVKTSKQPFLDKNKRISIDLGIDNLATLVSTTNMTPVLIKGTKIKSINAYYNKLKAHYYRLLRVGKKERVGSYTSKRLEKINQKRFNKIKDLFHKASFHIVKIAVEEGVGQIVIGKNQDWKQKSNIGKANNQNFTGIPHSLLIDNIRYKAEEIGIDVKVVEESYTSKASFLDSDPIPTYQKSEKKKHVFSGRRIKRGLYQSKKGILINADVNGAYNILRKAFPKALTNGIQGLGVNSTPNVSTPRPLNLV